MAGLPLAVNTSDEPQVLWEVAGPEQPAVDMTASDRKSSEAAGPLVDTQVLVLVSARLAPSISNTRR